MKKLPAGFNNTTDIIFAPTQTKEVVKYHITTGFNTMENNNYGGISIDLLVAGDS